MLSVCRAAAPCGLTIRARCPQLLMQHYSSVVEPAVEVSPPEAASCATGLAALTRAVEDRVTAALAASLACLASQVPLHGRPVPPACIFQAVWAWAPSGSTVRPLAPPQVDRTLAAEQRRSDFLPRAEGSPALELERPTEAALLVTALLRAAARVATANLHAANLFSFLTQVFGFRLTRVVAE